MADAAGHRVGRTAAAQTRRALAHARPRARVGSGGSLIYLDTSVVLAHLLAEDRRPPGALWSETLVASRLLSYEMWTRLHARGLAATHGDAARGVLERVAFVEMAPPVLARALEPFPVPVRTLDALHLATMDFLRSQGTAPRLASYDDRLLAAARSLRFKIAPY